MKINLNWSPLHLDGGEEKRNFPENNKNDRPQKPEIFIVKKNKKTEDFSSMLLKEFHGLKASYDRHILDTVLIPDNKGIQPLQKSKIISNDDFKAVQFLNEYWA
ncbi:MAG: hypothetical protein OEV66_11335 [Spirochaetia bacterium]|nr:hypothetical protein [Spirochaetia bacterium]